MSSTSTRGLVSNSSKVEEFGPWFHNLHLPGGVETAPGHPLGDFPRNKWEKIVDHLPGDLRGWTALDVGCNAGYYSFELARRGAQVTAVDSDPHYLRQAYWAVEQLELQDSISFDHQQVYDLAHDDRSYDLVWFMGVFYHLRYPLLALDILARKTKRLMVFQTLTMPGEAVMAPPENFELEDRQRLLEPDWPKMAFIEKRMADDPTNWWAANHACVEAMMRSCGLQVVARPAHEIYLCEPGDPDLEGIRYLNDEQYFSAMGQTAKRRPG